MTPRQTDLNLEQLSEKYKDKRREIEQYAFKDRYNQDIHIYKVPFDLIFC